MTLNESTSMWISSSIKNMRMSAGCFSGPAAILNSVVFIAYKVSSFVITGPSSVRMFTRLVIFPSSSKSAFTYFSQIYNSISTSVIVYHYHLPFLWLLYSSCLAWIFLDFLLWNSFWQLNYWPHFLLFLSEFVIFSL